MGEKLGSQELVFDLDSGLIYDQPDERDINEQMAREAEARQREQQRADRACAIDRLRMAGMQDQVVRDILTVLGV